MEIRLQSIKSKFVGLYVLFFSGFLFLTPDKRAGIFFVQEFFLFFSIFISLLLYLKHKNNLPKELLLLCIAVLFLWFFNSFLAYLHFGQPIYFGLFEERRMLFYISVIPFYLFLANGTVSLNNFYKVHIYAFSICIVISFLYINGVFELRSASDYLIIDIVNKSSDLRHNTRIPFASHLTSLVFVISLYFISKNEPNFRKVILYAFLIFLALAYQWLVIQKRTTMLYWFILALFMFPINVKSIIKLIIISILVFGVLVIISPDFVNEQFEKAVYMWEELFRPLEYRTRYLTGSIIITALMDNYFLGMGSLSQQWNGGFTEFYGPTFYLSDLSFLGLLFRYGIFALLIYILAIMYMLKICNKDIFGFSKVISLNFFIQLIININLPLLYDGQFYAPLLALLFFYKKLENEKRI